MKTCALLILPATMLPINQAAILRRRITALESAQNAEAILWLIGLDSNGTIPQSDLGFLERAISSQNKPLYIVLNKADRRTSDDWKDVLNEAREILDD